MYCGAGKSFNKGDNKIGAGIAIGYDIANGFNYSIGGGFDLSVPGIDGSISFGGGYGGSEFGGSGFTGGGVSGGGGFHGGVDGGMSGPPSCMIGVNKGPVMAGFTFDLPEKGE